MKKFIFRVRSFFENLKYSSWTLKSLRKSFWKMTSDRPDLWASKLKGGYTECFLLAYFYHDFGQTFTAVYLDKKGFHVERRSYEDWWSYLPTLGLGVLWDERVPLPKSKAEAEMRYHSFRAKMDAFVNELCADNDLETVPALRVVHR